jgi:hypothetical protein
MPDPVVAPALQQPLRCWSVQRVTGIVGHRQRVLVQAQEDNKITRVPQRIGHRKQSDSLACDGDP